MYLLDALDQLTPGGPVTSYYPLTMEQLGQVRLLAIFVGKYF